MIQPRVYKITGNDSSWLSFWGGYIGSIISASIAIFILWKQLNQNHEENEVNRKQNHDESERNRTLQLAILKHGQEKARLSELKKAFSNFMSSFNYFEIDRILFNMIAGNFEEDDENCLSNLMKDLDEKGFALSMYLPKTLELDFLKKYNVVFNRLCSNYLYIIKDLGSFLSLIKNLPKDEMIIIPYVEQWLGIDDWHIMGIKPENVAEFFPQKSIKSIVKEIGNYQNIKENVPSILSTRLMETLNDNSFEEFKSIIMELIESEEKRIDDLLIL